MASQEGGHCQSCPYIPIMQSSTLVFMCTPFTRLQCGPTEGQGVVVIFFWLINLFLTALAVFGAMGRGGDGAPPPRIVRIRRREGPPGEEQGGNGADGHGAHKSAMRSGESKSAKGKRRKSVAIASSVTAQDGRSRPTSAIAAVGKSFTEGLKSLTARLTSSVQAEPHAHFVMVKSRENSQSHGVQRSGLSAWDQLRERSVATRAQLRAKLARRRTEGSSDEEDDDEDYEDVEQQTQSQTQGQGAQAQGQSQARGEPSNHGGGGAAAGASVARSAPSKSAKSAGAGEGEAGKGAGAAPAVATAFGKATEEAKPMDVIKEIIVHVSGSDASAVTRSVLCDWEGFCSDNGRARDSARGCDQGDHRGSDACGVTLSECSREERGGRVCKRQERRKPHLPLVSILSLTP